MYKRYHIGNNNKFIFIFLVILGIYSNIIIIILVYYLVYILPRYSIRRYILKKTMS